MVKIIIGAILIGLQILSYIGNMAAGSLSFFSTFSVNEIVYFLGYNLIGIVGLVFLLLGIHSIKKAK